MSDRTTGEKWDAYPQTILEFDPRTKIDLREPVSRPTHSTLAALGLDQPFAVLTAENPEGQNAEDAATEGEAERREVVNSRRTSRLITELERARVKFRRVDGVSPDGEYREHCVAVVMSAEDATGLAEEYDQLALFWFDGTAFWLLPAEADHSPERLPRV